MPRDGNRKKRVNKITPTPPKLDTKRVAERLLIDTLAALDSIRGLKLTRSDAQRGLLPSFGTLTRTALELVKHIEEREIRDGVNTRDTKPPAVITVLDEETWQKKAKDEHIPKTTASD